MNGSLILAFALATANMPHTEAPAPPDEAASPASPASDATLLIEVDPEVPRAGRIQRDLEAHGHTALASSGTSLSTGDHILVRITGKQYDYHIQVITSRHEVVLDEASSAHECSDTDLNDLVSAEVSRAARLLAEATNTRTVASQPSTTTGQEQSAEPPSPQRAPAPHISPSALGAIEPAEPPQPPPRDRGVRRTKLAGMATFIAGSVLVIVGTGFAVQGSTELLDPVPHFERDWRPLGFALGGAGLGAMAAGGTLMIIDEVRCRRRPDACAPGGRYARHRRVENGEKL